MNTADCRKAITEFMPESTKYLGGDKWKREKKYKDCLGQTIRIFCNFISANGKHTETYLWVTETPDGLVVRYGTEKENSDIRIELYGG